MYCLCCDRWGLDGASAARPDAPRRTPGPTTGPRPRAAETAEAGRLRALRKEKRRRKRLGQTEAEARRKRESVKANPSPHQGRTLNRDPVPPPAVDFSRPPRPAPPRMNTGRPR